MNEINEKLTQLLEIVNKQAEEIDSLKKAVKKMQYYKYLNLADRREYSNKAKQNVKDFCEKYSHLYDFNKLPLDVRIRVLIHLNDYETARVDYWKSTNTYDVTSDVCLCSNEYEKPKKVAEFHKNQFDPEAFKIAALLGFGEQLWD